MELGNRWILLRGFLLVWLLFRCLVEDSHTFRRTYRRGHVLLLWASESVPGDQNIVHRRPLMWPSNSFKLRGIKLAYSNSNWLPLPVLLRRLRPRRRYKLRQAGQNVFECSGSRIRYIRSLTIVPYLYKLSSCETERTLCALNWPIPSLCPQVSRRRFSQSGLGSIRFQRT